MTRYVADLETTTDETDCRAWAWGLYEIETGDFQLGNNLDDFFPLFMKKSATVYFQNLKFDGEFILSWLFNHGYEFREDKQLLTDKSFTTLISDKGQWYSMTICLRMTMTQKIYLTINDSMKLLPFSVAKIAKAFNLEMRKGEIDYTLNRPIGWKITEDEREYIKNDVSIVGQALKQLFIQNMKSLTIGSNALKEYKRLYGEKQFDRTFPAPGYDEEIRKSYRGGFTYLKPCRANKVTGPGIVLDVNSLYPFVMYARALPVGEGVYFEGKYTPDDNYPLFVQMLKCQFELRPEHIPTIQIKTPSLYFDPVEFVTSSGHEEIALCLTSVDLKLFMEQYEVYNIEYLGGWKFHAAKGLFKTYIDKWMAAKIQAKVEDNAGLYQISKLMLNSLYGKFATNPNMRSKYPVYDQTENMIHYTLSEPEKRTPVYIPVGTFITAYAREITIRAAQTEFDRFIYADTDSLHLQGLEMPKTLELDDTKIGAWKNEFIFDKAFYIRAKTYIEYGREPQESKKYLKITCAGLPDRCHDQVTFENFRKGMIYTQKLRPKRVPGGIVLENCQFRIKDI